MMEYVKNAWYVMGWASEFGDDPRRVTILEEHIVTFRDSKGKVVARNTVNPYWQESCSFKVRKNGDRQTKKNLRFLFRSSG